MSEPGGPGQSTTGRPPGSDPGKPGPGPPADGGPTSGDGRHRPPSPPAPCSSSPSPTSRLNSNRPYRKLPNPRRSISAPNRARVDSPAAYPASTNSTATAMTATPSGAQ